MASKTIPRALRLSSRVAVPRRTFVSAVRARPSAATASVTRAPAAVTTRGIKNIDFAGTKETVYGKLPTCVNICNMCIPMLIE